jgi:hypothetical protein
VFDLASAVLIVQVFEAYLGIGLGVALPLLFVFAGRIDHGLAASPLTSRLILLPGFILLWPLLLARGLRGRGRPPIERNAHRGNRPATGSPS